MSSLDPFLDSGRSTQSEPHTTEGVRRILLEHLEETK